MRTPTMTLTHSLGTGGLVRPMVLALGLMSWAAVAVMAYVQQLY